MHDRYQIQDVLYEDRTGKTYLADDQQLDRQVAIRRLFPGVSEEAYERARPVFTHFMGKQSTLRAPGLLQVIDGGLDEDGFFQVVELLDGKLLSDRLHEAPFALEEFEQFSKDLLGTMEELHAHHLFHAALTAQSVQLCKRTLGGERYKLIDLGLTAIARAIEPDRGARKYGLIESALMPPEYFEEKTPDQKMDQFNLGQLFYASLVGGHPLSGLDREEIYQRLLDGDYPSPRQYREELPEELDDWISKMTAPRPEDRFENIHAARQARPNIPELAIKLMETRKVVFHTQHAQLTPSPRVPIDQLIAKPKSSASTVFACLTLLCLLVALAGYFLFLNS